MRKSLMSAAAALSFLWLHAIAIPSDAPRERKVPKVQMVTNHIASRTIDLPSGKPTIASKKQTPNFFKNVSKSTPSILAYRIAPQPTGLYSVGYDGAETMQWEGSEYWVPTTGFLYKDHIYGISAQYVYGSFYVDRMDYDILTGEKDFCETMSDNPAHAAISVAYDPMLEEAYAFTYTEELDGYMFNKLDPDSFTFTPINKDVDFEDVCIAMTFNEKTGDVMAVTSDGRFGVLDQNSGKVTELAHLPSSPLFANTSIVFSPADDSYFYQVINEDRTSGIIRIDASTYEMEVTHKWDEADIRQYSIMFTTDAIFAATSMEAPIVKSVDFADGNLSGSISIEAPKYLENGMEITDGMKLVCKLDGKEYAVKTDVQPGSTVIFNFSDLSEGLHDFAFQTFGSEEGKLTKIRQYIGIDTPAAPQNVRIENGYAVWDKVTNGEHNGYINPETVTYEVWLNGKKCGSTEDTRHLLDLPEEYTINTIKVYALSQDKRSAAGTSDPSAEGLYSLPLSIQPSEEDWIGCKVIDGNSDQATWDFSSWYGLSLETPYEHSGSHDDWVILPGFRAEDSNMRHKLTFTVGTNVNEEIPFSELEVCIGESPEVASMRVLDNIKYDEYGYFPCELEFAVSNEGPAYIAFHAKNGVCLYITGITIEQLTASVDGPQNVENISVAPAPEGRLSADVEFTIPSKSFNGSDLSGEIKVNVASEEEELSVTGMPGERMKVELKVPSGLSRIVITPENGSTAYSDEFYAGVDFAAPVNNLTYTLSEDNMEVSLTWDEAQQGMHGGYIDPESVCYIIKYFDDEYGDWLTIEEDLRTPGFTYTMPDDAKQKVWYFYVTAENSAGTPDNYAQIGVPAGNLYTLPIHDTMSLGGSTYEPFMTSGEEGYEGSWEYTFPEWKDPEAGEVQNFLMVGVNYTDHSTKGSLILPKFSPAGIEHVMGIFNFFFGDNTADFKIYAITSSGERYLAADVVAADMPRGYNDVRFVLPERLSDNKWLQFAIEPEYQTDSQCLIFHRYSIVEGFAHDLSATEISGPGMIELDNTGKYLVTIENTGYEACSVPNVTLFLEDEKGNRISGGLTESPEIETLVPGQEAEFTYIVTVDNPSMLGSVYVVAQVEAEDMNPSNDEAKLQVKVSAGNKPVVTDLTASVKENGTVELTWSVPAIDDCLEGFEDCDPFLISSVIGVFKNIDGDGAETYGYCFPYHEPSRTPTGWVIWDWEAVAEAPYNNYYTPNNGDRWAVAISPEDLSDADADDWLISPKVAGGTTISWAMAGAMAGVRETLEIMVSFTGDNPEDFTSLAEFETYYEDWTEESIQLPEDAVYFAIRYCSKGGSAMFIDDIRYTPYLAKAEFNGYDILRNNEIIAENTAATCNYVDENCSDPNAIYNVVPVYTIDGEMMRGLKSNNAAISTVGVESVVYENGKVMGGKGAIRFTALADSNYSIITLDGMTVKTGCIDADDERVEMAKGIYLVKIDNRVVKVNVY